jgi:hypothetical protein
MKEGARVAKNQEQKYTFISNPSTIDADNI